MTDCTSLTCTHANNHTHMHIAQPMFYVSSLRLCASEQVNASHWGRTRASEEYNPSMVVAAKFDEDTVHSTPRPPDLCTPPPPSISLLLPPPFDLPHPAGPFVHVEPPSLRDFSSYPIFPLRGPETILSQVIFSFEGAGPWEGMGTVEQIVIEPSPTGGLQVETHNLPAHRPGSRGLAPDASQALNAFHPGLLASPRGQLPMPRLQLRHTKPLL